MPDARELPAARGSDAAPPVEGADWRFGAPAVARWDAGLLARALISLGLALSLGAVVQVVWRSPLAAASASVIVLIGMLIPVVAALRMPRPAGLLRVHGLDLLYGVTLGAMVRLGQGWLEVTTGGSGALPSFPGDQLRVMGLLSVVLTGVLTPVVTELLRGVLLVATYSLLRRRMSALTAGVVAVVVATVIFVLVNAFSESPRIDVIVAAALLGLTCGLLVVLTGRIWGAVLVHVVYSASFVALALVGTILK